jgi:hypothetical protein
VILSLYFRLDIQYFVYLRLEPYESTYNLFHRNTRAVVEVYTTSNTWALTFKSIQKMKMEKIEEEKRKKKKYEKTRMNDTTG